MTFVHLGMGMGIGQINSQLLGMGMGMQNSVSNATWEQKGHLIPKKMLGMGIPTQACL